MAPEGSKELAELYAEITTYGDRTPTAAQLAQWRVIMERYKSLAASFVSRGFNSAEVEFIRNFYPTPPPAIPMPIQEVPYDVDDQPVIDPQPGKEQNRNDRIQEELLGDDGLFEGR